MKADFTDWFPLLTAGSMLTALGIIKLHGLHRGIVGGGRAPFLQRLHGT